MAPAPQTAGPPDVPRASPGTITLEKSSVHSQTWPNISRNPNAFSLTVPAGASVFAIGFEYHASIKDCFARAVARTGSTIGADAAYSHCATVGRCLWHHAA